MKHSLQHPAILATAILLLYATTITTAAAAKAMEAKALFENCKFDRALEYNATKMFRYIAFNPLTDISWTYLFDIKNQKVQLTPLNAASNTRWVQFDYKQKAAFFVCRDRSLGSDWFKRLHKSLSLPKTFPPSDSVPCGESKEVNGKVYSYYSKEYDFWFSVLKRTKSGKCQIYDIGLPGQKKMTGACFKPLAKFNLWTVQSIPSCDN